jgi:hypothetical protein
MSQKKLLNHTSVVIMAETFQQISRYPINLTAWPLVASVKLKKPDPTPLLVVSGVVGLASFLLAWRMGGFTGVNALAFLPVLAWSGGGVYALLKAQ